MDELQTLLTFTRHLTSVLDAKEVIAATVTQVAKLLEADQVSFFLCDEHDFRPVGHWVRPGTEACIDGKSPAVDRWLRELSSKAVRAQYTSNLTLAVDRSAGESAPAEPRSLVAVPLESHGKTFGVLLVVLGGERDSGARSALVETLARFAASTLHSALMHEQMTRQTTALMRETAEREKAVEISRRLDRALRVRRECHRALVDRSAAEGELLNRVCASIIESGGYRMAWVGYAEDDENRRVRPAARAGFENGYLEGTQRTWSDDEHGRGPTGTAIRTGRTVVVQDIENHPPFAPWIEAARRHGYRSTAAVPLKVEGRTIGVLRIYSEEPSAFSDEEVDFLEELAEDLRAAGFVEPELRIKSARMDSVILAKRPAS